jgi:hypothetical protein
LTTVSKIVKDILEQKYFLQEAISQRIISYNRLAENLLPEIENALGKKPKKSSIVMAIRRQADKIEKQQNDLSIGFFSETLLKTDMCEIILEESPSALAKIQKFYNQTDLRHGSIFNIVQANYEIGIITNKSKKKEILNLLSKENLKRIVDDLVIISLTYSKDYLFTPGVIYNVSRKLAWENINIYSLWITTQEFNLLISKEDTVKTFKILEKLIKKSKK